VDPSELFELFEAVAVSGLGVARDSDHLSHFVIVTTWAIGRRQRGEFDWDRVDAVEGERW